MLLRARLLALVAVALAGEEACDESGDTRGDTGSTSTLRVIHVTDVYQLDNLPSLGALIEEKRKLNRRSKPVPNSSSVAPHRDHHGLTMAMAPVPLTLNTITTADASGNELAALEPGAQTVSVLTGDFLMPYLLSTVDHGVGMMRMLK